MPSAPCGQGTSKDYNGGINAAIMIIKLFGYCSIVLNKIINPYGLNRKRFQQWPSIKSLVSPVK